MTFCIRNSKIGHLVVVTTVTIIIFCVLIRPQNQEKGKVAVLSSAEFTHLIVEPWRDVRGNVKKLQTITECNKVVSDVIKTRNKLSAEMNQLMKKLGQVQCEASKDKTNGQGGWCRNASMENGGEHLTDGALILVLSKMLKGKTVGSFGDGPGAYKRELEKLGEVKSYDAYDGAPFCEETSNGKVKFMDLTIPQYGLPLYDWVLSLEVAEHIPYQREDIYLNNIFRHAKEGIILSWAAPNQTGLSHINNRPFDYVISIMEHNGFQRDSKLSNQLQSSASLEWIKNNINVYKRRNVNDSGSWVTFCHFFK